MDRKKNIIPKNTIFTLLAGLTLLDLLFLNMRVLQNHKNPLTEKDSPASVAPLPQEAIVPENVCGQTCLSQIRELVDEATRSSKPLVLVSTPTPTPVPSVSSQTSPLSVKEFFIPFGSGSNSSDDWQDVGGLRVSVDSANYNPIKTVTFEASVRIPTGNQIAYVRLFNVTDKHPVWFSDVSLEGGAPALLTSKSITLDKGSKTYQVQMKTSLKYAAMLDQARLHIITF